MVVKSRYSRNLREDPNDTYKKEVKLQKEIEQNIVDSKVKTFRPETKKAIIKADECQCCKEGCTCCEHKSGTVGHRCICACHA